MDLDLGLDITKEIAEDVIRRIHRVIYNIILWIFSIAIIFVQLKFGLRQRRNEVIIWISIFMKKEINRKGRFYGIGRC